MAGPAMASAASAASPSSAALVPVIVQEQEGTENGPERAVEAFGGSVTQQFSVFQGFSAKLPADRFDALRAVPGVAAVTQDATLTLNGLGDGLIGSVTKTVTDTTSTVTAPVTSTVTAPVTSTVTDATTATTTAVADTTTAVADVTEDTVTDVAEVAEDTATAVGEVAEDTTAAVADVAEDAVAAVGDVAAQAAQAGSLYTLANEVTGASAMWDAGYTGQGVDVAVIDSGTVPVAGLDDPSRLVYGPDLSFEAGTPVENLDTNGHGTAMAGIIAGHDADATAPYSGDSDSYVGMAPDARIVSIKVADALGRTDVSQAIAAIDWVVEHGDENGLNIRVLNMSFGTDGVQSYLLDPLAYAAEQAWHKGIVAVVAVGNEGFGTQKVNNPAYDPYVLAVGSANANGTATTADDTVSSFSNDGDGTRNPDLVAPGERVVSLRSPNSFLDQEHPTARIGDRLFRGSGTSQAAAVVSGAAALLISQRPDITPDEVKALLMGSAQEIPGASAARQGSGLLDLATALNTPTPENAVQNYPRSTGDGSLEAARGSVHVEVDGDTVTGEVDVTGTDIEDSSAETIAEGVTEQQAEPAEQPELSGVTWSGVTWSGVTWSGVTWSGVTWSGVTWSGVTWSGVTWSGVTWSGVTWSGVTWSGVTWSGVTWSGVTWSSNSWS
ncbi:S8 family serine peptidase [Geodermatophilus sp. URMC 64]